MRIIAFDPGGTTGYSVGELRGPDGVLRFTARQYRFDHMELHKYLVKQDPDWIVCESFEFRNAVKKGTELISCEYIGVIKLYCQEWQIPLSLQTASTVGAGGKKGYFSNQKLKDLKFYLPAKLHAMDSLRHLLYWYEFGKGFQFNKKKGYIEA